MGRKEEKAYMTIEASLVLPLIIGGIIFIIYLGIYLYDASVIKQVSYIAALRGSQMKHASSKEIEAYVSQQVEELLTHQLLAIDNKKQEIKVSLLKVEVTIEADMEMPFSEFISSKTGLWNLKSKAEATRADPVSIIREVRKLNGS